MEATVRKSTSKSAMRRKVIDIKPDTFRGLSVIAASRGTNLKHFIETSLDEIVEAYDDAAVYRYLQQTDPEGPTAGALRVYRGGSWYSRVRYSRVSHRNHREPAFSYNSLGLRLAL